MPTEGSLMASFLLSGTPCIELREILKVQKEIGWKNLSKALSIPRREDFLDFSVSVIGIQSDTSVGYATSVSLWEFASQRDSGTRTKNPCVCDYIIQATFTCPSARRLSLSSLSSKMSFVKIGFYFWDPSQSICFRRSLQQARGIDAFDVFDRRLHPSRDRRRTVSFLGREFPEKKFPLPSNENSPSEKKPRQRTIN